VSAVICALAKRSEALACSEAFVASDRIRPNTTRWRSFVGAGSASAAASAARASASTPAGRYGQPVCATGGAALF
jgi:hypothetical protein